MYIETGNEISYDYGVVYVYVLDDIYYTCYPEIEGTDEVPEGAILYNIYNDDDSSSLEENSTVCDTEEDDIMLMTNYHLQLMRIGSNMDTKNCRRFDIESILVDYHVEQFNVFKGVLCDNAKLKLEKYCDSSVKSEMDNDLTQLFYETISTNVLVTDKNVCWYYENGIWQKTDAFYYLMFLLTTHFMSMLETYPGLEKAYRYLNSTAVRIRIIGDVKNRLYYPNFESRLDSNKFLIGVKNGTLNLCTSKVSSPKVSDLISKNTNVEYISYNMESRSMCKLSKILQKVFPIPDLLRFFIRSCSTFLEGENSKKVFYVWWGSGNNCKTGMATLVQSTFGEYYCTAPVSLITSKRGSSSEATPELCHIEGKLVVFLQEPNPREKMKTGRIKELTGNDKIFVRNLFSTGREIDIKCKIVHVCNFPTASPDSDIAFKRRMIVIKFPSTFLDESEYNQRKDRGTLDKHTFTVNENINNTLKNMGPTFLSILVREFQIFKEVGLQTPEIVRQYTEDFLTTGNFALKFIRKYLRRVKNKDKCINIHDVYESFKYWFKNHYPSYNVPNSEIFIKEMNDEGFVEDDTGLIHGVRISNELTMISL